MHAAQASINRRVHFFSIFSNRALNLTQCGAFCKAYYVKIPFIKTKRKTDVAAVASIIFLEPQEIIDFEYVLMRPMFF